jgi:predicted nucleic acid-binding Zn ribbon protein
MEIVCPICGITFVKNELGRTPIYCSAVCGNRAKDRRRRERYISRVSAPTHENCMQCGVTMPEGKRSDARFCTERCFRKWNIESNGYERQSQAIENRYGHCVCGKSLADSRANVKYCSLKCNQLSKRLQKYDITYLEYHNLLELQNNACAICESMEWGFKGPNIDHCHSTGKVRGLLCQWCNRGLGIFEDDYTKLERAIEYLKA